MNGAQFLKGNSIEEEQVEALLDYGWSFVQIVERVDLD